MYNLRSRRLRDRLIPLLSFVLLLQGLFPLQLHTILVKEKNGSLVEVCTINGLKTIKLDDAGNLLDKEVQDDSRRSAAIAFSELMAEVVPDITVPVITRDETPSSSISNIYTVVISEATSGLKPIRAPPVA
ncbi:MAG: hypothetical protein EP297_00440 [Gammaproteobacteria bacterium]|nr:MAG: hypothetical protein EP297_00440 [Gammaproteobacteria bacterium]